MTDIDDMLRAYEKHAAERLKHYLNRPLHFPDDAEQVRSLALAQRLRDFRAETQVFNDMRAKLRESIPPFPIRIEQCTLPSGEDGIRFVSPLHQPLTGEAKKADDALLALIRTTAERYGIAEFVVEAPQP